MDYIFIVNPKSRTGQGELLWSQLEPELKKRRVSYEVRMTGRKKMRKGSQLRSQQMRKSIR